MENIVIGGSLGVLFGVVLPMWLLYLYFRTEA